MAQRAVAFDLGVEWDPICEDALLIMAATTALLVLPPHFDDPDQRDVVLRWQRVMYAELDRLNDEARGNHRLIQQGMGWGPSYLVRDSELVADLEWRHHKAGRNRPPSDHTSTHFVVTTKGEVAEVVASSVDVQRIDAMRDRLWADAHL